MSNVPDEFLLSLTAVFLCLFVILVANFRYLLRAYRFEVPHLGTARGWTSRPEFTESSWAEVPTTDAARQVSNAGQAIYEVFG